MTVRELCGQLREAEIVAVLRDGRRRMREYAVYHGAGPALWRYQGSLDIYPHTAILTPAKSSRVKYWRHDSNALPSTNRLSDVIPWTKVARQISRAAGDPAEVEEILKKIYGDWFEGRL